MILDYTYSRNKKNFSISYIKEDGMKSLLKFKAGNNNKYCYYTNNVSDTTLNVDNLSRASAFVSSLIHVSDEICSPSAA